VKPVIAGAAAAAILAAAVGGFVVGHDGLRLADITHIGAIAPAAAQNGEGVIYYQDPDGKPVYSLAPKRTSDGRNYRAVPAGADVNFDEPAPAATQPTHMPPAADRKIKYYRNPMGLPDTSPMPKKDNMGMDYIPVYEGDESDDGSVKLSPGKIQRTGVKSEPAAKRVLRTVIRAPGSIALDERRISVITMRSESFVQKVANVTVGTHVVKGQPLMEIYSPAISSASAEYVSTVGSTTTARNPSYGPQWKRAIPYRSPWNGPRRATASFLSATPSKACGRNRARCCSGSPITPWFGRWSMSPNAILAHWRRGKTSSCEHEVFQGASSTGKSA
jgi:Cu(I)/Ag(I) efflux system membrane fusion protein